MTERTCESHCRIEINESHKQNLKEQIPKTKLVITESQSHSTANVRIG